MATMATTHGLTVLTNSCVKPPLNPKTGLSTTMHERARTYMGYGENGFDDDYAADDGRDRRKERTWPSGLAGQDPAVGIEAVSRELLNGVDGEDFYAKLTQLKNEHRKTLEMYESLYQQKVALKQTGKSFVSNENNEQMDVLSKTAPVYDAGDIHDNLTGIEIQKASTIHNIPYTSTANKPPTGRPSKSPSTMPGPKRSRSPPRHAKSLTRSLDEEVWKKVMMQRRSSEEYDFDEDPDGLEATKSEIYDPRDISAAMSRIDDMWENFSVQEYAPGSSTRQRPSSAMITKREKEDKVKEWRHRITIPKPFKMTIREDNKEKKKSQTQLEHEDEMFRRQKEEEIECQKRFKATPVPAHIYLPLYDEIIEKNESRRRHVKDYSEELLKSQEKPFNFLKREEDKRHRRTCSAPSNDKVRKSQTFKARPVPSYIFDTSIDSQIQEEEEYRKIRIKMRSEELLQSAALPPNMELREKVKEMKNKEKMIKSKKKDKFRPKVNHEVPDYDELYKQFQKELARRKYEKETTVTKPFKLNTCNIASTKGKILKDIERDEETMRENRWPFKSSRATPRSSRLGKKLLILVISPYSYLIHMYMGGHGFKPYPGLTKT